MTHSYSKLSVILTYHHECSLKYIKYPLNAASFLFMKLQVGQKIIFNTFCRYYIHIVHLIVFALH